MSVCGVTVMVAAAALTSLSEGHRKTYRPREHATIFFNVPSSWETNYYSYHITNFKRQGDQPHSKFQNYWSNVKLTHLFPNADLLQARHCDRH